MLSTSFISISCRYLPVWTVRLAGTGVRISVKDFWMLSTSFISISTLFTCLTVRLAGTGFVSQYRTSECYPPLSYRLARYLPVWNVRLAGIGVRISVQDFWMLSTSFISISTLFTCLTVRLAGTGFVSQYRTSECYPPLSYRLARYLPAWLYGSQVLGSYLSTGLLNVIHLFHID